MSGLENPHLGGDVKLTSSHACLKIERTVGPRSTQIQPSKLCTAESAWGRYETMSEHLLSCSPLVSRSERTSRRQRTGVNLPEPRRSCSLLHVPRQTLGAARRPWGYPCSFAGGSLPGRTSGNPLCGKAAGALVD